MDNTTNDYAARYWELSAEAQRELDERLANVRNDYEAGEISIRDAADKRVELMEKHLAHLRELRARYLGEQ